MEDKFKVGDRVIYVSGGFGDRTNNPLWGGSQGNIVGTVEELFENWIRVRFDNSCGNSYYECDLELHVKPIKPPKVTLPDSLFED
jgi:hypothetical protein